MRYHIDTIPLWDALKAGGGCPLCMLRRQAEAKIVERSLGAAVMSSEERVKVNQSGFCRRHQEMLYANSEGNRLGHALMMLSHLQTLLPKTDKALAAIGAQADGKPAKISRFRSKSANRGGEKAAEALTALVTRCVHCSELEIQTDWQMSGFLHLWKTDPHFRESFRLSGGLCLPDAAKAISLACETFGSEKLKLFVEDVRQTLMASLTAAEADLLWYTQKFDYRNTGKSWGTSRDALERTVNHLRGWCLGHEPI